MKKKRQKEKQGPRRNGTVQKTLKTTLEKAGG
jgi:hypothetical protein